jgi:hypothetical protein
MPKKIRREGPTRPRRDAGELAACGTPALNSIAEEFRRVVLERALLDLEALGIDPVELLSESVRAERLLWWKIADSDTATRVNRLREADFWFKCDPLASPTLREIVRFYRQRPDRLPPAWVMELFAALSPKRPVGRASDRLYTDYLRLKMQGGGKQLGVSQLVRKAFERSRGVMDREAVRKSLEGLGCPWLFNPDLWPDAKNLLADEIAKGSSEPIATLGLMLFREVETVETRKFLGTLRGAKRALELVAVADISLEEAASRVAVSYGHKSGGGLIKTANRLLGAEWKAGRLGPGLCFTLWRHWGQACSMQLGVRRVIAIHVSPGLGPAARSAESTVVAAVIMSSTRRSSTESRPSYSARLRLSCPLASTRHVEGGRPSV